MSKPKTMSAYPPDYLELLTLATQRADPLEITLGSKKEAETVRFDLYGFRNAANEENYPQAFAFSQLKFKVRGKTLEISRNASLPGILAAINRANLSAPHALHPESELKLSEDFQDFLQYEVDDTEPSEEVKNKGLEDTLRSLNFTLDSGDDS